MIWIILWTILISGLEKSNSLEFRSYISEQGLHGTVTFTKLNENETKITTDLIATLEYPQQTWSWFVSEFPVDYSLIEERCSGKHLGQEVVNMDDVYGYLFVPENATSQLISNKLRIAGDQGLYGKSLLLKNLETNRVICSSIVMADKTNEKTAVARFTFPISGSIYFRWFSTKDNQSDMLITTDLYHVFYKEKLDKSMTYTEHKWKLYVTDILESDEEKEENCNSLQTVFDPQNRGSGNSLGDIDARLGKVKISTDYARKMHKTLFRDEQLIFLPSDVSGAQRRLYLVLFESKHPNIFLACSKIIFEHTVSSRILIQSGGIKGDIVLTQKSKFEPTFLNFNLTTSRGDLETKLVYSSSVAGYKIHELPVKPARTVGQNQNSCLTTKFVYNPLKLDISNVPPTGYGTQDQYPIGDLSGKLRGHNNESVLVEGGQELTGKYWDVFLPLQGQNSVIHRSLVIYKNTQYSSSEILAEPWICGNINMFEPSLRYQTPMFTAEVIFRYPIVGRMIFRQPRNEPGADTTVIVEYLVHADGATFNNSMGHRWAIHEHEPGKDFYNWTGRCLSAGNVYNPYKIDYGNISSENKCSISRVGLCRMGDVGIRQGTLAVSGKIAESDRISRTLVTDPFLPLTGPHSILGKSFVLYDDHGPQARGERLACSIVSGVYRRKAVVKDWFPNGESLSVKGKIELLQQTEYDTTNIEVNLEGLKDTSGYHIHIAPVEESLEFPCEGTSLYGHWNPLNVDPASSPRRYLGTPDQYEMGDLSGKFGTLDNHTLYKQEYNDTFLTLFGPRSILGRSVVIHKKDKNRRWACSTIERGYSPSEARELRAIASFHHPFGYAYGYMKMKQLIYRDGSRSDTTIEVKLRYPGKHDRNVTREHNWAIYVNPVGVDASVKEQATRCVAGGYIWNPFYTQLADPLNTDLYNQECGPENPLRCYVGDLSARLGTVDIGLQRKVFTDSNLPLEGDVTAIGRSIVILSPNKRPERYACANIEPDYDIVKYANVDKPPRFVLAQFIDEIREVMGIPEWFLTIDSRKTKSLHNDACVQVLLHFKGPIAKRLEQDFSKLLSIGRLDTPSLYIPGYIKEKRKNRISYKQCGIRDPNEKGVKKSFFFFSNGKSNFITTKSELFFLVGLLTYYFL